MRLSPRFLPCGLVCLLTLTLSAPTAQADAQRRGGARSRGAVVTPQGYRAGRAVPPRSVGGRRGSIVGVAPGVRYRTYVAPPRFSVGVYVGGGYYRPYPYAYGYPYPYSHVYRYPAPYPYVSPVYGVPGYVPYGGLRLDVTPRHAAVLVDGYYAGVIDDFDGKFERAPLAAGPHRIDIETPGYETLAFDVNVLPGQTIRYRGDLRPAP